MKRSVGAAGLVLMLRQQHGADAMAFALARVQHFETLRVSPSAAGAWREIVAALGRHPK